MSVVADGHTYAKVFTVDYFGIYRQREWAAYLIKN